MPIDFPTSPALNEIYTFGGRSWQWNGVAWDLYNAASGLTQYVSTLNGLCGSINIAAGTSISVTPTGNTLTIAYTGGGGITGPTGGTGPQGNTGPTGPTGPQGNTGNDGNTGATGQQGEPGQSSNYYNYKVHTASQTPPTGDGEIRYNNATQTSSTVLYVDHLDNTGDDIDVFLSLLKKNDNLIIQDFNDSNNYQTWRITSAPTVILNDYTSIPVTGITSAGTGTSGFANNNQVLFIVFSSPIATAYVESLRGLTGAIGLTNGNGIDLSVSGNTLTFSNTGVLTVNGSTGAITNVALTTGKLSQFASTTSAELASIISNETGGGGVLVFNTSPTITTSITTASTSFALVNTTATTLNLGGAATTLTMGGTSGTASIRNATLRLGNTTNTIDTNSGTTNNLNIQPYGNLLLAPLTTAISLGGTVPSLTVSNTVDAAGFVTVAGGDLLLSTKSTDGGTFTPVNIIFEGASDNTNETTLTVVDPTADRTITFPDASGTVALTSGLVSSLSGSTFISVSGSTGAVTITNTGVQTFNGLTGAVTGVTVGGTNVFTALNTFNAGLSAAGGTFGRFVTIDSIPFGAGGTASYTPTNQYGLGDDNRTNVAIGRDALSFNISEFTFFPSIIVRGVLNTAIGYRALQNLSGNTGTPSAYSNTALGSFSLSQLKIGYLNTGIGSESLSGLTAGNQNIGIGSNAGAFAFASGNTAAGAINSGIYIGADTRASSPTASGEIVLGQAAVGLGSNTTVIGSNSQTSATIYGLLNAPSGISAAGATFSGLIRANAGISASGITVGGSIVLQNQEFIQNTTNGRMDFMPAPAGSTHYGMYMDFTSWSYGVKLGTIRASDSALNAAGFLWEAPLTINGDVTFNLGSNGQNGLVNSTIGNNTNQFYTNTSSGENSGAFAIVDSAGVGAANRSPGVTHTNPNLYVYRSGSARATDFIRIEHDGTNGRIVSGGTSGIKLEPGSGVLGISGSIDAVGATFSGIVYTDNIQHGTAGQLNIDNVSGSRIAIGDYNQIGNNTSIFLRDTTSTLDITNPYGDIRIGDINALDNGMYITYSAISGNLDGGGNNMGNFSFISANDQILENNRRVTTNARSWFL